MHDENVHNENVLMESRSMRGRFAARTDTLDKVKALALLPDGLHVTTQMVADYFVVHRDAIHSVVRRHRDELTENGLTVLRGADLHDFQMVNLTIWKKSYPQAATNLTLYTRRTVLNIAMLLRDSTVARQVRAYLLDTEEHARRSGPPSLERRVTGIESVLADIGPALRDLGPMIHRMSVRLERVEQRVNNTDRVVGAMSARLADVAADLKDLRRKPPKRPPHHP